MADDGRLVVEVAGADDDVAAEQVFYPGELVDRVEEANRAAGGILLPPDQTLEDLSRLARETGLDWSPKPSGHCQAGFCEELMRR